MQDLSKRVVYHKAIVDEDHLNLYKLHKVNIPGGKGRTKRFVYLVEARNRALEPLEITAIQYHKILHLSDVAFNPIDALQLLFSNVDHAGIGAIPRRLRR